MNKGFLAYYQQILDKVSFDYQLLKKEYFKAMSDLSDQEIYSLNQWLKQRGLYPMLMIEEK